MEGYGKWPTCQVLFAHTTGPSGGRLMRVNVDQMSQDFLREQQGDTAGALRYLRANSNPSDEDTYKSVKEQIESHRAVVAGASQIRRMPAGRRADRSFPAPG